MKDKFNRKKGGAGEGEGEAVKIRSKKQPTASAAETKKWNEAEELAEISSLEKEAAPLLKRGKGVSQTDRDAWSAMMKAEKEKQKK